MKLQELVEQLKKNESDFKEICKFHDSQIKSTENHIKSIEEDKKLMIEKYESTIKEL